jgi:ubiquinone/menaquinone biosynthesis C-methylase UbiE
MITTARERLPTADLRIAELENLPFSNTAFDAVSSMNSLQYTTNPQLAVHELGRVCREGGRVAIAVHGDAARSDMTAVTEAIFALFDKRPSGGPFALSSPDLIRSLVDTVTALSLEGIAESMHDSEYPSLDAAVRGMMSAGGSRRAAEIFGDDRVRTVTRDALAPFVDADGAIRLRNHYRIATAIRQ